MQRLREVGGWGSQEACLAGVEGVCGRSPGGGWACLRHRGLTGRRPRVQRPGQEQGQSVGISKLIWSHGKPRPGWKGEKQLEEDEEAVSPSWTTWEKVGVSSPGPRAPAERSGGQGPVTLEARVGTKEAGRGEAEVMLDAQRDEGVVLSRVRGGTFPAVCPCNTSLLLNHQLSYTEFQRQR